MADIDELRQELDKDELDYPELASRFGQDAVPQLGELVAEDEPRIASKAAYLAGLIAGSGSDEVVARAAQSRHDVVRVAAAGAIALLPTEQVSGIADRLLNDPDPGVRIRTVKSAMALGDPSITSRVRAMADKEPDEAVRSVIEDLADRAKD
jgi:HEAT repeat protein